MNRLIEALRRWARRIREEVMTLWFAVRDARSPWTARALGAIAVAYALSPIDLIPDFIPVLGYLDELILLPLLIWLALRLLPPDVLLESRARAHAHSTARPRSLAGAVVVVAIWLLAGVGVSLWLLRALSA